MTVSLELLNVAPFGAENLGKEQSPPPNSDKNFLAHFRKGYVVFVLDFKERTMGLTGIFSI